MRETPSQRRSRIAASNIRRYRLAAGLSQRQLAQRVGVGREHVARWETAMFAPGPKNAERLAQEFGIAWQDLYEEPEPELAA